MDQKPLLSICIPAYNRVPFLQRLLESIAVQQFTDFEVIVTDDSTNGKVEQFLTQQVYRFPLQYIRNQQQLGTPRNWTEGMKYASGTWIKIMHDDDWFAAADSLKIFTEHIDEKVDCIFSGYSIYNEQNKLLVDQTISTARFALIQTHPYLLFAKNELGPPSVLLFRSSMNELYDPSFKWLVDLEAYIRMMLRFKAVYIPQPLITMSRNDTQVTNEVFRNAAVEIKEALMYYQKLGAATHAQLYTYDAWWRLLRNLSIRSKQELVSYADGIAVPEFLLQLLRFQQKIPMTLLKNGVVSKLLMSYSFLRSKRS